jgi:hypothetical protein
MTWIYVPSPTSLYSPVPADSTSEQRLSEGLKPSATSNGTNMLKVSSCQESEMEDLIEPRYGTTFLRLKAGRGVGSWILSLAASRAKTYQLPESKRESKEEEADFGSNISGSYAKFDQDSSLWRMSQGCLWGGAIGVVLGDLASSGYDAEWSCFSASQVGAPHKRERVWIVAYPHGIGWDGLEKNKENFCSGILAKSSPAWGNVPFDISLPMDEYEAEPVPGVLRMDDGVEEAMDGVRLCGNGVVPQQSVPAWEKIKQMANSNG